MMAIRLPLPLYSYTLYKKDVFWLHEPFLCWLQVFHIRMILNMYGFKKLTWSHSKCYTLYKFDNGENDKEIFDCLIGNNMVVTRQLRHH